MIGWNWAMTRVASGSWKIINSIKTRNPCSLPSLTWMVASMQVWWVLSPQLLFQIPTAHDYLSQRPDTGLEMLLN